jgi:polysaccharide biosynthesis protein PelC
MPFDNHTHHDAAGMEAADQFIQCLFKTERYTLVHPVEAIKKLMGHTRGCLDVDEIEPAQKIGKALGCDAILIGEVRTLVHDVPARESPEGKKETLSEVSARLVDVGTGKTLWLSHYTIRPMSQDAVFNRMDLAVAELAESLVQKYPGKPQ